MMRSASQFRRMQVFCLGSSSNLFALGDTHVHSFLLLCVDLDSISPIHLGLTTRLGPRFLDVGQIQKHFRVEHAGAGFYSGRRLPSPLWHSSVALAVLPPISFVFFCSIKKKKQLKKIRGSLLTIKEFIATSRYYLSLLIIFKKHIAFEDTLLPHNIQVRIYVPELPWWLRQ